VNGTQVGILEKTNEVSLRCLLKSQHSRGLEPQIGLKVLSNLTNKTLEGGLADEKISGLLVLADFAKGDGSGTITVGFLNASGGGGGFAGCLWE
jgi:hypothetical protein